MRVIRTLLGIIKCHNIQNKERGEFRVSEKIIAVKRYRKHKFSFLLLLPSAHPFSAVGGHYSF